MFSMLISFWVHLVLTVQKEKKGIKFYWDSKNKFIAKKNILSSVNHYYLFS